MTFLLYSTRASRGCRRVMPCWRQITGPMAPFRTFCPEANLVSLNRVISCLWLSVRNIIIIVNVFAPWFSVPARRRRTGRTMPAEAIGRLQEAEEQMLFETCEEGTSYKGTVYCRLETIIFSIEFSRYKSNRIGINIYLLISSTLGPYTDYLNRFYIYKIYPLVRINPKRQNIISYLYYGLFN